MLVLRRKVGEALLLTGGIEIEVVSLSRSRVKLGIRAPKDVQVQRKEGVALAGENHQASLLLPMGHGRALPEGLMKTILLEISKSSAALADK